VAESGFYRYFRDVLGFGPLQGDEDRRPIFKGLVMALCLGLDKLGLRTIQVRDEHTVDWCADARLDEHAIERGIQRLESEDDDTYRKSTKDAYKYHWPVGRRDAFDQAIKRVTDVPYRIVFFGSYGWKWGDEGFADEGLNAAGAHHVFVVEFLDYISDEAFAEVQKAVFEHGQAQRDFGIFKRPDIPVGILRFADDGFGVKEWGPGFFDYQDGERYYLGEEVLPYGVSADSETSGYEASSLIDLHFFTFYRSTGTSAAITLDLDSAKTVNDVALIDHNLTSGATISIQGNDTDSWGSPAFSQALQWASQNITSTVSATNRYFRLVINDPGNPDGYVEMADWFVGQVKKKDSGA